MHKNVLTQVQGDSKYLRGRGTKAFFPSLTKFCARLFFISVAQKISWLIDTFLRHLLQPQVIFILPRLSRKKGPKNHVGNSRLFSKEVSTYSERSHMQMHSATAMMNHEICNIGFQRVGRVPLWEIYIFKVYIVRLAGLRVLILSGGSAFQPPPHAVCQKD